MSAELAERERKDVEAYLDVMFVDLLPDEECIGLCSSQGRPSQAIPEGAWFHRYFNPRRRAEVRCYVNTASLAPIFEDGRLTLSHRNGYFTGLHFVILDDIGSRCRVDELPEYFTRPTARVQTSEGNWQYVYRLQEPIRDPATASEFVSLLYAAGPWDSGGALACKYVRLPCGIHNQLDPWRVRLDELHDDRDFDPVRMLKAAGATALGEVPFKSPVFTKGASAPPDLDDPLLDALERTGQLLGGSTGDFINVICPWHEEHTNPGENSAGYRPVGVGDDPVTRGFHCFHGHCAQRTTADYLKIQEKLTGEKFDVLDAAADLTMKLDRTSDDDAVENAAKNQFSDVANRDRFWQIAGPDLLYVAGIGWMAWRDGRWQIDPHEAQRVGQQIGGCVVKEASAVFDQYGQADGHDARETTMRDAKQLMRHTKYSESAAAIKAAIALAESTKPIAPAMLDCDPLKFNCLNGTLDLTTCELLEPERGDYLTKHSAIEYDRGAECRLWEKTLLEIFEDDQDVISFVQRWFGYCLSGRINEQVLCFFYGQGANGKDVVLGRIRKVLGEYCGEVAPGLLTESKGEQHPTGVYDLRGRRLGVSSETGEDRSLDETLVKQITGSDTLKARGMRQDFIEFTNETKIVLMTNHPPKVKGVDYAIWRRILMVPFNRIFTEEERDETLGQKLDERELPGILRWCVDGFREYQKKGLKPPASVRKATKVYRSDQDELKDFLEIECAFGEGESVSVVALYDRWKEWCFKTDQKHHSREWLGRRLTSKKFEKRRTKVGAIYMGIGLKPATGPLNDE